MIGVPWTQAPEHDAQARADHGDGLDLPIVIEIVDTEEKIEEFLPIIDNGIPEGLATIERVAVHF